MAVTDELSHPDYLEALNEMAEEGIATRQARLAEWLGVTPASGSLPRIDDAYDRLEAAIGVRAVDGEASALVDELREMLTGTWGG